MTQDKIDRINELARKQRTEEGLTDEERAEQQKLRSEYINSIKRNLSLQLENTVIVDEKGNKRKVQKKEKNSVKH
ncbi:MAG: DUF896 domain-containing protein [Acutalibacteraceae bacterium]|jgi:uncharacterized protein YnzC (UPF0291/DUF896 family)|nr:DUF896 domain-containing protein [Clostridia bacterium]MBQ1548838.1 DUF896 domain-containing protein [Clostridia bacterium]MBQ2016425.1 DUF896 domain-containing protein [Clostridia bacterium]MEE1188845.1 DUF896 domain-containing protein [Acutalibacteraceae bacterium]MEE3311115.1 DUF896 domain-containing protein [Acutalibacteraceae bacterium]